jgi:hypothetical protein
MNSTLEIRVARRPWLLEKIMGPKKEPSIKMNPPRPPADFPDPPSASRMIPRPTSQDGWVRRGGSVGTDAKVADPPGPTEDQDNAKGASDQEEPSKSVHDPVIGGNKLRQGKDQRSMTNAQQMDVGSAEENGVDESVEGTDSPPENEQIDSHVTKEEPPAQPNREAIEAGSPESAEEAEAALSLEPAAPSPAVPSPAVPSPAVPSPAVPSPAVPSPAVPSPAGEQSDTAQPPVAEQEQQELADSQPAYVRATRPPSSDDPPDEEDTGTAPTAETTEEDESPSKLEGVKIRALQIDSNGRRLEKPGLSQSESETSRSKVPSAPKVPLSRPASKKPEVQLDYTGNPKSSVRLTRTVRGIQNSMRQCLRYYYSRTEVANERSNWGMLHSIMVYGADTRILVGNKSYSAIAWIAGNNACRGKKLLTDEDGYLAARSGIGLQGHQAQMLCVFALCGVPADYPLFAGDNRYTVQDIIETEMLACKSGQELTFTLIGLAHYLDTDAVWTSSDGQTWDFERLIREELGQPIVGAACGGTHRLLGFAHALRKRRAEGHPITGQWKRAEVYTRDFIGYAFRIQNRDGSMSTDWFEGREDNGDIDRKIQTTGHVVEWLLTVTPDSRLQDPRLVAAIRFLLTSMYNERDHDWKIGPKGHALRSLAMFYERVYRSGPAWQSRTMAKSRSTSQR